MNYEKIEENLHNIEEVGELLTSNTDAELYEEEDIDSPETITEKGENNPAIKEFLDSEYGSQQEQVIKKMMAAAAIASGSEASPEEIASQADASAVSIKTAYKVSNGEVDITESTDILIDQAAARLNTFIQKKLDLGKIGEKLVDVVSLAYPPAAQLKPYVKVIMKKAEPVVRKAIATGINKVATYAKKTIRTISTKVKNFAKALLA